MRGRELTGWGRVLHGRGGRGSDHRRESLLRRRESGQCGESVSGEEEALHGAGE